MFLVVTSLVIVAFLACGQQALAAENQHHWQIKVVPRVHSDAIHANSVTAALYPGEAAFAGTAYPTVNSDGLDLWPCFGDTATPNTDCPTIGNPSITFPTGGVVLGAPSYTWSLEACNATSTSTPVCGQTETWYEDDSNDSTDDLTYEIEVTQGSKVIADSGVVDFGPNVYGGLSPAANVIIYGDQNFGTMGETGKNNGNCTPDLNYPTASDPAGELFIIAANKTCVAPVAGVATLSATTSVATPKYKLDTKTGTYTVTYTVKYKATQKWNIDLQ
jgi:hypothetical protein